MISAVLEMFGHCQLL